MKDKLIELDNHQIKFQLGNSVYEIPRFTLEKKFKLYWFKADLYRSVIEFSLKETTWFNNYKI